MLKKIVLCLLAIIMFSAVCNAGVLVNVEPFNTGEALGITAVAVGIIGITTMTPYGVVVGMWFLYGGVSLLN